MLLQGSKESQTDCLHREPYAMASEKCDSPFLGLPPEIRNRVYRLVLVKGPDDAVQMTATGMNEPALLSLCKQVSVAALNTARIKMP